MQDVPAFSVILPAHKYNTYLEEAILSVLNQSFTDFELILILNGPASSNKNKILSKFNDERIKIVTTPLPNLVFALNLGLTAARAAIIVRMDSDDICLPNRLSVTFLKFQECKDLDVMASNFELVDEFGSFIRNSKYQNKTSRQVRSLLPFRCVIAHPTVAFNKKSIMKIGGYAYGPFSEDYDLWLRLARFQETKFLITEEVLLKYRIHDLQVTSNTNDLQVMAYDFALKVRELILTKKFVYLAGATFTIVDFFYKKILLSRCKRILFKYIFWTEPPPAKAGGINRDS